MIAMARMGTLSNGKRLLIALGLVTGIAMHLESTSNLLHSLEDSILHAPAVPAMGFGTPSSVQSPYLGSSNSSLYNGTDSLRGQCPSSTHSELPAYPYQPNHNHNYPATPRPYSPFNANSSTNANAPAFHSHLPDSSGKLQDQLLNSSFYYGYLSTAGKRTKSGILVSDLDGSIYVGGWCTNKRHGLGISFIPTVYKNKNMWIDSKASLKKYKASICKWSHGFIIEHITEPSNVLPAKSIFQLSMLEIDGMSLDSLKDLFHPLIPLLSISSCEDTVATSVVEKPSHTNTVHSAATKISFIEVNIGENGFKMPTKNISYGTTTLPPKTLSNSTYIPFYVTQSKEVFIMLFTTDEASRPTAILWEVDEGALATENKLMGTQLATGFEISQRLNKSRKYYLEVGTSTSSSASSSASSATYKIILNYTSFLSKLNGHQKSIKSGDFKYTITVGGEFIQKNIHTQSNLVYRVGTFSWTMTPYLNKATGSIMYYYANGDKCNSTPRTGKLIVVKSAGGDGGDGDDWELMDIQENPTCVYTVTTKSKYAPAFDKLFKTSQ